MSPMALEGHEFSILPIRLPALPSCPIDAIHEIRMRRNAPKIPTINDSRSLFLKNIPVDSTDAHFRALFTALVGAGKFESIVFEEDSRLRLDAEPAQAAKLSVPGRKRKRDEKEADEREKEEAAAKLPEIWTRKIKKSGSSAVVLLADDRSVEVVLKAAAKARRSKKYPVWGEGVADGVSPLGSLWISAHLQMCRTDKTAVQNSVHAFFNAFNRKEQEAAELAKRLRNEPDEDGFVTVTRGGRAAPANKTEAEEARRKMLEKEAKKKSETRDFYRFQLRERRKRQQAALVRRFEEDRKRVDTMKQKRGKFKPET